MAIYTKEEREETINIMSDFYKAARGYRPRGIDFNTFTDKELKDYCDMLSKEMEENRIDEENQKVVDLKRFEALVEKTIASGAKDRATALKWLWDAEDSGKAYSIQCVQGFVYSQGLLFTEYGEKLVEELKPIVPWATEEEMNPELFNK